MSSKYPGTLDSLPTTEGNSTKSENTHPELHNDANDAINKIEAELGTNPSGEAATVKARIEQNEAAIQAGLGEPGTNIALINAPNAFTETQTIASGKRLGIGTAAPEAAVHLIEEASGQPRGLTVDVVTETINGGSILLRKARGKIGEQKAILKGDSIGAVAFNGWDGVEYPNSHQALIQGFGTEDWANPGNHGCKLALGSTPNATAGSPVYRLFLDESGFVGIDSEAPETPLHIGAQRHFTSPSVRLQDGAGGAGEVNATYEFGNSQSGWVRFGRVGAIKDATNTRLILDSDQSVPIAIGATSQVAVGVGVKNPVGTLDVVKAAATAEFRVRTEGEGTACLLVKAVKGNAESKAVDLWTTEAVPLNIGTNQTRVIRIDSAQNVLLGAVGRTTASTAGFPQMPAVEGTPTGAVSVQSGFVPWCYDKTNNKLYVLNGTWKGVALA